MGAQKTPKKTGFNLTWRASNWIFYELPASEWFWPSLCKPLNVSFKGLILYFQLQLWHFRYFTLPVRVFACENIYQNWLKVLTRIETRVSPQLWSGKCPKSLEISRTYSSREELRGSIWKLESKRTALPSIAFRSGQQFLFFFQFAPATLARVSLEWSETMATEWSLECFVLLFLH